MDLSTVDDLGVSPQTEDRVLVAWASRQHASNFTVIADDGGYVNADDVVWRLLSVRRQDRADSSGVRDLSRLFEADRTPDPGSGGSSLP